MTASLKSIAHESSKNRQYWAEQIRLKQESGLTSAAYCREHRIICSRFYYWEHQINSAHSELSQLLPVKLYANMPEPHLTDTKCTLMLNGGYELKVHDQAILPLLLSLLS